MIKRLGNIDDSSLLAIIADRAESADVEPIEPGEFDEAMQDLHDQDAKRVAEILISRQEPNASDSDKVRKAVIGLRQWVHRNRTVHAPLSTSRGRSR